jgi:hypothetical protein
MGNDADIPYQLQRKTLERRPTRPGLIFCFKIQINYWITPFIPCTKVDA